MATIQHTSATALWSDDAALQPYADLLHTTFAHAVAARFTVPLADAHWQLTTRVNWLRLARQCAFFMTNAYVPFVAPGASPEGFPTSVYGEDVTVTGFGPYRRGTFDRQRGFIGPSGNLEELSLGPVNGQFHIREFERAMWSVFTFAR